MFELRVINHDTRLAQILVYDKGNEGVIQISLLGQLPLKLINTGFESNFRKITTIFRDSKYLN